LKQDRSPMKNIMDNIKRLKDQGRKVIGCFPLYPPLELFHSMGLAPVTLWGLRDSLPRVAESDRHIQPYACSVARRLMEFLLKENSSALDGLFMYNACDTLRNLPEIIDCGLADAGRPPLPIFKMHIPAVPPDQTDSRPYLRASIEGLIGELEKTCNVTFAPDKFRRSVSLYREMRELSKMLFASVADGSMSYGEFSRIVTEGWFIPVEDQLLVLQSALRDNFRKKTKPSPESPRVVVSGILPPPLPMIRDLENAGITVVGNDVASQNRALHYSPPAVDDPAEYYIDFYHHHYPCTTLLHSADRRLPAIRKLVSDTGARGVVFVGEKFCEYEYFEFPYLEQILKEMGIRALLLDISLDDDENTAAYTTRIETFAELMHSTV
ncbi:MAG TPA: 2-hydroxyacyl-CoA dehydratase family protein, partial [Smithellaceae bacterium]|nr:2-hydroxyacyl-CoA dehydratase family protein [Smithellaceae bacterium]HPI52216.1 2-hydroxyacyl-CoA dehydratase family protein [Smithellaceae bacterium]HPV72979.1 2-hydroxyacyl-CoA dehydratase family protein [Smithellaceae bacterium]HQK91331.1 2-hydroxyacyl-CoA dehydratase family protein [Smithellaceae bacterium]